MGKESDIVLFLEHWQCAILTVSLCIYSYWKYVSLVTQPQFHDWGTTQIYISNMNSRSGHNVIPPYFINLVMPASIYNINGS
jgi:hypothetical protein